MEEEKARSELAGESPKAKWNSPQITAPLLMFFVVAAMHLSRYILGRSEGANPFLSISLIQILVLIFPCMIYYLLKKRSFATPLMIGAVRLRHIPLMLASVPVYVFGILLLKYVYLLLSFEPVAMYGFFDEISGRTGPDASLLGVIISLVVIPAVCEEFLFRGVLLAEYNGLGEANAVVMSSVCFAILHFSVQNFPAYLLVGLLLGILTVVSRSLIPGMVLHLVSNALNLFVSDSFLRITMQKNGRFFVGFILIVLFAASLALFLYLIEYQYIKMGSDGQELSLPLKNFRNIPKVFLSPTFLILLLAFVLFTVLG